MSTKLGEIFKLLDGHDKNNLRKLMMSDWYSISEDARDLYERIAVYDDADRVEEVIADKKYIWGVKRRLAMSQLYQLIEYYLVSRDYEERPVYYDKRLLEIFRSKNINKLFRNKYAEIERVLERSNQRDSEYWQNRLMINQEKLSHESGLSRSVQHNYSEIFNNLDTYHTLEKLKYACLAIMHNQIYADGSGLVDLEGLIHTASQDQYKELPSIQVYLSCLLMLMNLDDESYFIRYKKILSDLRDTFNKEEHLSLYLIAINYCIRRQNMGDTEYTRAALNLYKDGLDQELFIQSGRMSRFTYKNIAALAIKGGEYSWALRFSEKYKPYLRKREMESSYQFNQALISYHEGDLDLAVDAIQRVDFNDHLFNLSAKILQLKIYYDQEEYMLLQSHLDALQMYVLRKKIIGYHKENVKNIIKYTKKLMRLHRMDKEQIIQLINDLETKVPLTEKAWMIGIAQAG